MRWKFWKKEEAPADPPAELNLEEEMGKALVLAVEEKDVIQKAALVGSVLLVAYMKAKMK